MALGSAEWKTTISLSLRFENITKLTECFGDLEAARAGEAEIFASAASLEEYSQSCAALTSDERLRPQRSPELHYRQDELPTGSSPGVTIGGYNHATPFAEGITSTVYRASNKTEHLGNYPWVALKVIRSYEPQPPHHPKREARILRKCAGPRIIPLLDTFETNHPFVLVFPFISLDLDTALKQNLLKPVQIQSHLRHLFEALKHIHSQDIIHRDIKPSALLLVSVNGPAYLSDFGIGWMPGDSDSEPAMDKETDVGTTCYRAPELLFGHASYGVELDLWSAGCIVAEALDPDHTALFDAGPVGTDLGLIRSIFSKLGTPTLGIWPEAVHFPDWGKMDFHAFEGHNWKELLPRISEEGRDLIDRLVVYESGERRPATEALCHPYFMHED